MRLNELKDKPGALKARKRVGRGPGSGKGKTAGRGHKGQNSRSGVALKGFEGGQMPIHMRLPKRGFNNPFRKQLNEVNLGRVQEAVDKGRLDAGETVTVEALRRAGVIRRPMDGVRLLGKGELKTKMAFEVTGASAGAVKAVEKAGGSVTVVPMPKRAPKAKAKPAEDAPAQAGGAAKEKAQTRPATGKTGKTASKSAAAKKTAKSSASTKK